MAIQPSQFLRGGFYTFCNYSGIGSAGEIAITLSGQNRGRLNSVVVFNQALVSGVGFTLYDGANVGVTLLSGGPFPSSGHIPLFQLPAWPAQGAASGSVQGFQLPFNMDQPFFSGLNLGARSGGPGFTATYTIERPIF